LQPILFNENSPLETKVELIASSYIDFLLANQDLPIFILTEIRNSPDHFLKIINKKELISSSSLAKQLKEKRPDINPIHFIINIIGLCVFPFIMKPVLQKMIGAEDKQYFDMVRERKLLIPTWVKAMLKAK